MLRALRSRGFTLATLAAFLVAQPVVVCSALCLIDGHAAGTHMVPGMNGGSRVSGSGPCHATAGDAAQRDPFQVLSPMAPTRAPLVAVAPTHWVEPVRTLPTPSRSISRTTEPPPPRFV
ncbi:MAG: hypothetical protein ABI766_14300 [Gemmatimonadales bacterium]